MDNSCLCEFRLPFSIQGLFVLELSLSVSLRLFVKLGPGVPPVGGVAGSTVAPVDPRDDSRWSSLAGVNAMSPVTVWPHSRNLKRSAQHAVSHCMQLRATDKV